MSKATIAITKPKTLHIPTDILPFMDLTDPRLLSQAVAQVIESELRDNSEFQFKIRAMYLSLENNKDEMPASRSNISSIAKDKKKQPNLTPINHVSNFELNLAAPPNPFILLEIYGDDQLYDALNIYTLSKLKEAAKFVEQQTKGAKIVKTNKDALIVSLVKQVTQQKI